MEFALWSVIVGFLLIFMALSATVLARLPLSTAMLYLMVGLAVSPWGMDLMRADVRQHAWLLERFTEVIVLISLFTAGLKLSPGAARPAVGAAAAAGPDLDGDHRDGHRARRLVFPGPAGGCLHPAGRHPGADRPGAGIRRAGESAG